MDAKPTITVIHSLPHRRRLRLSVPPEDTAQLLAHVKDHAGIRGLEYNQISRSLLVCFNPEEVHGEEILMRVAVALSEQKGLVPVYILPAPAQQRVPAEVWLSGAALIAAYGLALGPWRGKPRASEWLGGLSTSAAVLEHARREKKEQGTVDPEVWTLLYLVFSFWRGRPLRAAVITWMTVFGRHLTRYGQGAIEIKPRKIGHGSDQVTFEVALQSEMISSDRLSVTGQMLQSIIGLMGGQGARFMGELQQVARLHDQVLHGLGRFKEGVPLMFS